MNLCLESHLEVTGGGLLLRAVGLEATGSAIRQQALPCSQTQGDVGVGCTPGGAGPWM